mmetsp:Transcript_84966/g.117300  ORF Transcript_84966/g.117300 Transcript_84966/m.117300 type:complete len:94 (-) Transcript_84966:272-553(-)
MCPLRLIVALLAAFGLASYMSPLALGAASRGKGDEEGETKKKTFMNRLGPWLACLTLAALHIDLFLSLGYTKCAFQFAAGLHREGLASALAVK